MLCDRVIHLESDLGYLEGFILADLIPSKKKLQKKI